MWIPYSLIFQIDNVGNETTHSKKSLFSKNFWSYLFDENVILTSVGFNLINVNCLELFMLLLHCDTYP